jgi:hypothetical protein
MKTGTENGQIDSYDTGWLYGVRVARRGTFELTSTELEGPAYGDWLRAKNSVPDQVKFISGWIAGYQGYRDGIVGTEV